MNEWVSVLAVFNGGGGSALYAGGWFTTVGGNGSAYLARWQCSGCCGIKGDFNGDGDVNLLDFRGASVGDAVVPLQACLGRAEVSTAEPCAVFDFDDDGNVDLKDFAGFQLAFDGHRTAPPGMVLIPGGSFQMGDTFNDGSTDERPVHTVSLSPYFIGATEVTNAQYAAALNWARAQGNQITVTFGVVYKYNSGTSYLYCDTTTSDFYSRITWNGSSFGVVAGKENHPMVMVSWYGAVAYANWRSAMEGKPLCYDLNTWTCNFAAAGYRLPTEAEWEKAARGGTPGHRFPWSDADTIQHARANYYSYWSGGHPYYSYDTNPTAGFHPMFSTGGYPYTSPVGYFAPNGYGVYDMAGNVGEGCNDWYSSSYYSSSPGSNPTGLGSGTCRVVRGGSWSSSVYLLRCANRGDTWPDYRYDLLGFRLALDSE